MERSAPLEQGPSAIHPHCLICVAYVPTA